MRRHTPLALSAVALAACGLLTTGTGTAQATPDGATYLALFGDAPHGTSNSDTAELGDSTGPCASSVAGTHPGYDVPGFHRITVHGSTFPLEWLKLTISPRQDGTFGPFSWERQTTSLSS